MPTAKVECEDIHPQITQITQKEICVIYEWLCGFAVDRLLR